MLLSRSLESYKKILSYQESLADGGSQEVGRAEDAVGPSAGASELGGGAVLRKAVWKEIFV